MPESVTDRPTKAHSYVFLLTKRARYFFDSDAIREHNGNEASAEEYENRPKWESGGLERGAGANKPVSMTHPAGRNARSVWSIPTEPTPFAHFATFPQALVERCIKAGTSEHGSCSECGAPWRRITEKHAEPHWKGGNKGRGVGDSSGMTDMSHMERFNWRVETTGWEQSCRCDAYGHAPVPCVVLDPFMGSGTTALVARRLGRHALGIELNPEYLRIAAKRLEQLSLLTGDAS